MEPLDICNNLFSFVLNHQIPNLLMNLFQEYYPLHPDISHTSETETQMEKINFERNSKTEQMMDLISQKITWPIILVFTNTNIPVIRYWFKVKQNLFGLFLNSNNIVGFYYER